MRESVTFQAILEEGRKEGRVEELHRVILRQGRRAVWGSGRGGSAADRGDAGYRRLEDLTERLLIVSSWDELMA
jgi:hypothetical protein